MTYDLQQTKRKPEHVLAIHILDVLFSNSILFSGFATISSHQTTTHDILIDKRYLDLVYSLLDIHFYSIHFAMYFSISNDAVFLLHVNDKTLTTIFMIINNN